MGANSAYGRSHVKSRKLAFAINIATGLYTCSIVSHPSQCQSLHDEGHININMNENAFEFLIFEVN